MSPWGEGLCPCCSHPGPEITCTSPVHHSWQSLNSEPCFEGEQMPEVQVTLEVFEDLGAPPWLRSVLRHFLRLSHFHPF